jgi:hypothetical protein
LSVSDRSRIVGTGRFGNLEATLKNFLPICSNVLNRNARGGVMHFSADLQLRGRPLDSDRFEKDISGLAKRHGVDLAAEIIPVCYPKGGMFLFRRTLGNGGFSSAYWPGERVNGFG